MLKGHGGNPREAAQRLGLDPEKITDFSASVNPFVDAALLREMLERSLEGIGRYPDPEYKTLRRAVARKYGLQHENVLAGNGSTELLYLVPRALKPRNALIVSPSYADYADAVRMAGTEMERLFLDPKKDFQPDFEAIGNALAKGFDMAILGNPNNPTGTAPPKDALLAMIRAHRRTIFMVDESFADFAPGNSLLPAVEPNLIVVRSLTKFYGVPGLRIGFASGAADVLEKLTTCKEPWTVNCVAEAAVSLLDHPAFADTAEITALLRQRFYDNLSAIPSLRVFPSSANFLLARIEREGMTAAQLQSALLHKGFLIRDCANFEGLGPRYFRVAVRSAEENARLADAIRSALG